MAACVIRFLAANTQSIYLYASPSYRITSQVLPASRFRTTFQLLCSGAVRSFLTVLPAFPSAVIVELVQKEREKRQLPPLVVRRLEISDLPMLVSSMFFEDSYEEMHGVVSQV